MPRGTTTTSEPPGARAGRHTEGRETLIEVRFAPSWSHIEPFRAYVESYFSIRKPEATQPASLIVHELLENAIKYGKPTTDIKAALDLNAGESVLEISVANDAVQSRITALQKAMSQAEEGNPQHAFQRAMARLREMPEDASMLGLSRLRTEANANFELHTVGSQVTVTARSQL